MPTSVGLQCTTNDGAEPNRTFGINFGIAGLTWTQAEPGGTSDIFKTKSGKYVTVANTTSLKKGDTVVAVLTGFNPSMATDGDAGNNCKQLETARTFGWKVIIVVP